MSVEAEQLRRSTRKTRRIARRLKRAERLRNSLESELESKASTLFASIGRGYGAFCTRHNYDSNRNEQFEPKTGRLQATCELEGPLVLPDEFTKLSHFGEQALQNAPWASPLASPISRQAKEKNRSITANSHENAHRSARATSSSFRNEISGNMVAGTSSVKPEAPAICSKPASRDGHPASTQRPATGFCGRAESVFAQKQASLRLATARTPRTTASVNSQNREPTFVSTKQNGAPHTVDPRVRIPSPSKANHASEPVVFVKITSVCNNRPDICTFEPYVPPYTVERLKQEQRLEAKTRRLGLSSSYAVPLSTAPSSRSNASTRVGSTAKSPAKSPAGSSKSDVHPLSTRTRQEIFLTTRGHTPRRLASSPEACRLNSMLERKEKAEDELREQEAKAAPSQEKDQQKALTRPTTGASRTSSAFQYERIRHVEQTHHQMGMRSRGVICHTYRNLIPKPWKKLVDKQLPGDGITADTIMIRGGPGTALLVSEKGPCVPVAHKNGEFTDLILSSKKNPQHFRPMFFYGI